MLSNLPCIIYAMRFINFTNTKIKYIEYFYKNYTSASRTVVVCKRIKPNDAYFYM